MSQEMAAVAGDRVAEHSAEALGKALQMMAQQLANKQDTMREQTKADMHEEIQKAMRRHEERSQHKLQEALRTQEDQSVRKFQEAVSEMTWKMEEKSEAIRALEWRLEEHMRQVESKFELVEARLALFREGGKVEIAVDRGPLEQLELRMKKLEVNLQKALEFVFIRMKILEGQQEELSSHVAALVLNENCHTPTSENSTPRNSSLNVAQTETYSSQQPESLSSTASSQSSAASTFSKLSSNFSSIFNNMYSSSNAASNASSSHPPSTLHSSSSSPTCNSSIAANSSTSTTSGVTASSSTLYFPKISSKFSSIFNLGSNSNSPVNSSSAPNPPQPASTVTNDSSFTRYHSSPKTSPNSSSLPATPSTHPSKPLRISAPSESPSDNSLHSTSPSFTARRSDSSSPIQSLSQTSSTSTTPSPPNSPKTTTTTTSRFRSSSIPNPSSTTNFLPNSLPPITSSSSKTHLKPCPLRPSSLSISSSASVSPDNSPTSSSCGVPPRSAQPTVATPSHHTSNGGVPPVPHSRSSSLTIPSPATLPPYNPPPTSSSCGAPRPAQPAVITPSLHTSSGGVQTVPHSRSWPASPVEYPRRNTAGLPTVPISPERREALGKSLREAARAGNAESALWLLNAGADVNFTTSHGWTPLMDAAYNAHADVVSLLLERGADIRAKTQGARTALHLAACHDRRGRCVFLLLNAGSPVDAKDADGDTPLHCAARLDTEAAARALLAAGANTSARNKRNQRPGDIAGPDMRVLLRE